MKKSLIAFTSVVYSVLAIIFILLPSIQSANLIDQTCKQTPLYNLCVSSLRSDPHSSGADVRGLARITVNIIQAKAAATETQIKKLLKARPELKAALSSCAEGYNAILQGDIPQAIEALVKGDYKFAEQGANDAAIEASLCEKYFPGNSSPITKENKFMQDISRVAASIVRMLL